ncbi:unnamed protein product [Cuscuta epithymum]|uniref:Uncharacterized protein n=1 Tax=Cuscuta epithymum TaxID=186058 RepID=A0AAV0GKJ9_9ASTE|nr:unnamed protein product [Cuscuta epithymum]
MNFRPFSRRNPQPLFKDNRYNTQRFILYSRDRDFSPLPQPQSRGRITKYEEEAPRTQSGFSYPYSCSCRYNSQSRRRWFEESYPRHGKQGEQTTNYAAPFHKPRYNNNFKSNKAKNGLEAGSHFLVRRREARPLRHSFNSLTTAETADDWRVVNNRKRCQSGRPQHFSTAHRHTIPEKLRASGNSNRYHSLIEFPSQTVESDTHPFNDYRKRLDVRKNPNVRLSNSGNDGNSTFGNTNDYGGSNRRPTTSSPVARQPIADTHNQGTPEITTREIAKSRAPSVTARGASTVLPVVDTDGVGTSSAGMHQSFTWADLLKDTADKGKTSVQDMDGPKLLSKINIFFLIGNNTPLTRQAPLEPKIKAVLWKRSREKAVKNFPSLENMGLIQ